MGYIVASDRAQLAARAGDLEAAIAADRRAIESIAELIANSGELAPLAAASFREAYLHLIGLYASNQRFTDALDVIALLDAQSLLTSRAAPSGDLPRPNRAVSDAPRAVRRSWSAPELIRAWQGRTLVIFVPDGESMWRLMIHDGGITGIRIGEAAPLIAQAYDLERAPLDAERGRELGDVLLQGLPALPRVDVLFIGPIARVPLPSLRFGAERAAARWKLVRVLGVLPNSSQSGNWDPQGMVMLADPQGDIHASRTAAEQLAQRLGATLYTGVHASRAALASARGRAVLHIVAHTRQRGVSSVIELADGDAGELEVGRLAPSPRIVVLTSCASAVGADDNGHGSVALAFINAGAELVVATSRSIRDDDAASLMHTFYANGGASDPIGALAAAHALAASTANPTSLNEPGAWHAFEVVAGRPSWP